MKDEQFNDPDGPRVYVGDPTNPAPPAGDALTSRRLIVSFTLATDVEPGVILAEMPRLFPPAVVRLIVGTSAHTFDLDDDTDEASAYMVLRPAGDTAADIEAAYLPDQEPSARRHAEAVHGVLIEVPVVQDYRLPVADGD